MSGDWKGCTRFYFWVEKTSRAEVNMEEASEKKILDLFSNPFIFNSYLVGERYFL